MLIWTRLPVNVVNIKISKFLIKFNYRTNTPWIYLIIEWYMFFLVEEADPTTTKTKKNRNDCGIKVVIFLAQKKKQTKKDEKMVVL